jgi:SAM-dependent methyltransferase
LPSGHQHDLYNNGYFAVAPSVFHAVMRAMVEQLHLDFQRFRFVDLGSGKGRALMLASDYPFREIIGVELSPELDRVARSNIARYSEATGGLLPRPPVISMQGDATDFAWPAGPLIVYMWNAFTLPVMERVFRNLESSLKEEPRELFLVYIHPELESMLAELPWLVRLWREPFPPGQRFARCTVRCPCGLRNSLMLGRCGPFNAARGKENRRSLDFARDDKRGGQRSPQQPLPRDGQSRTRSTALSRNLCSPELPDSGSAMRGLQRK